MVGKRLLDGVQPAFPGQALDGGDGVALRLHGQHQTGVDHDAVQVDRAGGALPLVAGPLGAGQPEVVAQRVDQRAIGLDQQVVERPVDLEPYR